MTNSGETNFSEQLSTSYLRKLKERHDTLVPVLSRLQRDRAHLSDFDTLEHECHKLAGTGATYGFPAVSEAAIPISELVHSGRRDASVLAPLLDTLLNAMAAAMTPNAEPSPVESKLALASHLLGLYKPVILVADDDPQIRDLLAELLTPLAIVETFETGNAALEAIKLRRFDVALFDHQLPDMTGLELLTRARALIDPRQTAIMMITALSDARKVAELLQAGANDYLVKPFLPHSLVRRVQTQLGKRQPTVLVADDDPLIRAILRPKLEQQGVTVLLAANGAEALAVTKQERPNVVILDRAMPRMEGLDVLAEIRRHEATRTTAVVLLSARRTERDILDGVKHGADDYVPKPFLPDDVVGRCLTLLRRTVPQVSV